LVGKSTLLFNKEGGVTLKSNQYLLVLLRHISKFGNQFINFPFAVNLVVASADINRLMVDFMLADDENKVKLGDLGVANLLL